MRGVALLACGLWLFSCAPARVWFWRTPDRLHRIEVLELGRERQRVRLDERELSLVEAVGIEQVAWHPRAGFAWPARVGGKWVVVWGERTLGPYDAVGALLFSPDGEELALAVEAKGKWTVARGGGEGPWLDAVYEGTVRWSEDSRHLAWAGQRGKEAVVVLDGAAGAPWDAVGSLALRPGPRLAYVARRGGLAFAVLDGEAQGPFEAIAELTLGPRGQAAVLARQGEGWRALVGGRAWEPFDALGPARHSPDGEQVAMFARRGGAELVLVNGAPSEAFDEVRPESVAFTGDGKRVVFAARKGRQWSVPPGPWFDEVSEPRVAEAGQAVAYGARRGAAWFLVHGGREQGPFEQLGAVELSVSGQVVAAAARSGGRAVLMVNEARRQVDGLIDGSLALSADGRHLAFLSSGRDDQEVWLFIDGRRERELDLEEILAVEMKAPPRKRRGAGSEESIRAWVRAELAAKVGAAPRRPER